MEYEDLCASEMAVVRIPCASIDLSGDPVTAGAVFDATRWFRVSHCTHPPKPCNGQAAKAVHLRAVGVAMSVYPTSVGHFVPEQWPRVMLLHHFLPPDVPSACAAPSAHPARVRGAPPAESHRAIHGAVLSHPRAPPCDGAT